jgi:VWFA-related protein
MRRLTPVLAIAIAISAFASFAQQPLVETIEVRIANIDVVVQDRAGHSIVGLTKDDFELLDDGVGQKITNFYEVRRGDDAPATAGVDEVPLRVRQRRVVVFVDTASLAPSRKAAVLQSVQRFIDHGMRPEDQCMLVSWRFGTHIVTPFTGDRTSLRAGLETMAHESPAGETSRPAAEQMRERIQQLFDLARESQSDTLPLVTFASAYEEAREIVGRHGQLLIAHERQLLAGLDAVATSMAGLEGKKVLVFVAETLPENPAADLYRYINNLFGPYLNRNRIIDFETTLGVMGHNIPAAIEELSRDASANGVTMYTIGAAGSDSDFSAGNDISVDYGYAFARDANTSASLETIATMTGGVAITRTSNFDLAFDTIDRDLSSYYSLGYKPAGEGGHDHKILVRTKNPAYRVRSRRSFVIKSSDEQMADRAIANLYVDTSSNDWPISVRTGAPKRDGRYFVVPLQVVIPSTITLIPQSDKLAGGFTLYFAVGDASGRTSTVMRRPQNVEIPPAAEANVRNKPITFTTAVRVSAGESVLSVAIVDQLSGATGFTRAKIVAR